MSTKLPDYLRALCDLRQRSLARIGCPWDAADHALLMDVLSLLDEERDRLRGLPGDKSRSGLRVDQFQKVEKRPCVTHLGVEDRCWAKEEYR